MGRNTTASGNQSTAMGLNTTASGDYSTAMGYETTASGTSSTAMGELTTASGKRSTAMGYYITASDWASTVIGQYNSSGSTATSATSFSTSAPAFVIGNGNNSISRSDAFKVMFNGDATVSNDLTIEGSLILGGESYTSFSGGDGALSTVSEGGNTGVRLSSSDAANHGDIGEGAVDLSYSDSSSSTRGATGDYSTAMGQGSTATGTASTAMGEFTTASDYVSTAMGRSTTSSGYSSTALGNYTTASGTASTAMGASTTASGESSTAMGVRSTASGVNSTAMGRYSTASDYASTVIGQYNSSGSTVTSATSFSTSAPAFVVGNGTGSSSRSDAFKVMFNGDATVSNDLMVNGDVTVSSDARLKANIVSLGATLSKLLNIDGKTYTIKKNGAQKIGVLAQDIQEVFPELVSEDNEGMLSVNYQGLIPVLINALKEQEAKFQAQEERLQAIERVLFKE
ncbi:MAG: hypothetical protein CMC19_10355 [Flavobacteriaceae bacterium]|nr:hypothetical protein [Flavobacteriaceae bacterium]